MGPRGMGVRVETAPPASSPPLEMAEGEEAEPPIGGSNQKHPSEIGSADSPAPPDDPSTLAMLDAFISDRDFELGRQIYEKLQEATGDEAQRLRQQALYLYLRYHFAGEETALDELRRLADKPEATVAANTWLGMLYTEDGRYQLAEASYRQAAEMSTSPSERATFVVRAAKAAFQAEDAEASFAALYGELARTVDQGARTELYKGLADLFETTGESALQALALELATESSPNNPTLHFQVAYLVSQAENEAVPLAAIHYEKLLAYDSTQAMAWNNLGVQYLRLSMPFKATSAYRRAADQGETLAMANIAHLLINAGFRDQAVQELVKAQETPNAHVNVAKARTLIAEKDESETKRYKETLETGRQQQRFLRDVGKEYFRAIGESKASFEGEWQSDKEGVLSIEVTGTSIACNWRGRKIPALRGEVRNRAVMLKSVSPESDERALGLFSEDSNELRLLILGEGPPRLATFQHLEIPI